MCKDDIKTISRYRTSRSYIIDDKKSKNLPSSVRVALCKYQHRMPVGMVTSQLSWIASLAPGESIYILLIDCEVRVAAFIWIFVHRG